MARRSGPIACIAIRRSPASERLADADVELERIVGLAAVEVLASARDEPLTIGGSIANGTATDRVNVRYDDGSGANADTRTTFINRTGASRDMACEVML